MFLLLLLSSHCDDGGDEISVQASQGRTPATSSDVPLSSSIDRRKRARSLPFSKDPTLAETTEQNVERPTLGPCEEGPAGAGIFEYLAERASREKVLEKAAEEIRSRERNLDRKLKDAELQIHRLKAELEAAAARQEGRESQLKLQQDALQTALQREAKKSATLELELRRARDKGSSVERPRDITSPTHVDVTRFLEQSPTGVGDRPSGEDSTAHRSLSIALRDARNKADAAELELQRVRTDFSSAQREIESKLALEQERSRSYLSEIEALKGEVSDAKIESEKHADARRHAEARCAQLEADMMTSHAREAGKISDDEGTAALIRTLTQQLRAAETASHEASRLKEQAQMASELRERLEFAEARARRAEGVLETESGVHAELAQVQAELDRWKTVLTGVADCTTPEEVLRMIRNLQERQLAAKASEGDTAEMIAAARADANAAQAEARDLEAAVSSVKARAESAEAALARANRRIDLLQREKGSLKKILVSYEDEGCVRGEDEGSSIERDRIRELEEMVESLNANIADLESELSKRSASQDQRQEMTSSLAKNAASDVEVQDLQARVAAAETRATTAETEAAELARQVDALEMRVARGEYNPETTKVLHLKNNPEAELQRSIQEEKIARLESENDALKANLRRFESINDGSNNKTSKDGLSSSSYEATGLRIAQLEGEANLLRRRLADAQKVSDRLQQVFTRQIATFREAVAALFGYRVEMTTDPSARDRRAEFVLRPMKASEPAAQLLFHMLRDGRLVMIPTEYSRRRLAREVETYVDRFRSIPALTANLTMELFQQQTQT